MLRRATAAVILVVLTILLAPCPAAAQSNGLSHKCCAPTASLTGVDCCHSANPHRNLAALPSQHSREAVTPVFITVVSVDRFSAMPVANVLNHQPPQRPPTTILRT